MILTQATKDIWRSWRFSLFFIMSFSLGLSGFFILDTFKYALNREVAQNAKNILSADFTISARRKISDQEQEKVQNVISETAIKSEAYEFFAMMNSHKGTRLVLVKAIDTLYPFYGSIEFSSREKMQSGDARSLKNNVWISADLQTQMGLAEGETIQLGKKSFKVQKVIQKDSTQTFRAATLAPRVFIDLEDLNATELIQFGSTYTHLFLYKLKDTNTSVAELVERLYKEIPDPAVRIDTPETASEEAGRQLNYLFDFLGLVAIVGLFMSSMGGAYLFRLYLNSKVKQIAIFRALGLTATQVFKIYVAQIMILSLLALIPSFLVAYILNPVFAKFLSQISTFQLQPMIQVQTVLICAGVALFGGVLTSLHQILEVLKQKPSRLFSGENGQIKSSMKSYWVYIFAFLFFCILSIVQAKSWKIGLAFVFVLLIVIAVMIALGGLLFRLFELAKGLSSWYLKYGLLSISRNKMAALSVFVSIGLGTMLINLLPQLKNSLQNEFRVESKSKTPSLFMFDIQDDQIQKFLDYLKSKTIHPMSVSPLIRSRIIKINDELYERKIESSEFKTREEEREARSRNRGVNLSYRDQLSESEEIIEGKGFSGRYDFNSGVPFEISIETRYSDRMGLKIGDRLTFDIQGIEIEGRIINIRKVKWTTFQPNFFMLVQPGVLDDAPKTFIASVPQLPIEQKGQIQQEITQAFTNVSTLDVSRVVEDTLKTSDQMSWSLELMSALALIAGYIILFSIIRTHLETRRYEFSMIKVLGGSGKQLLAYILNEYILLTFLAGAVGSFLSVFVSYGISYYIFEGVFTLSIPTILYTLMGVVVLTMVIGIIASFKIIKIKPASILKAEVS